MPLMDSLVDRTWLRKVSLSLEYDNRLPKLKGKKVWEEKKQQKIQEWWNNHKDLRYTQWQCQKEKEHKPYVKQ